MEKKTAGGNNSPNNEDAQDYYYVQGQKIPITKRDDLIAVRFDAEATPELPASIGKTRSGTSLTPSDEFQEMQHDNLRIYIVPKTRSTDLRSIEEEIREQENVSTVGEVFVSDSGRGLVLTDELVVKFKPDLTEEEINSLQAEMGLEERETLGFSENAFVLGVASGQKSALEVANILMETGRVEYAYPNWIEYLGYRIESIYMDEEEVATLDDETYSETRNDVIPTDPQFGQQWHLRNTGQTIGGVVGTPGADIRASQAWRITMGSTAIRLAVIDGGVDVAHNDLNAPSKVVAPINLMTTPPTNNPLDTNNSHGTEVAGMAVARANNGVVGSGSAPNCRLIPIRAGDTMAQVRMAQGFQYAADNGADVITCSLGPVGSWPMTDALREAIDYATTFGRNGRGCAYFQAVDNRTNPINLDQVSSYERSIAVSRTNNRDRYDGTATALPATQNQSLGPAMGPELDLCAPGRNVLTITNCLRNASGVVTNANTQVTTSGTSFATPLTAGVACLVLSRNPRLSWQEVKQVMLDSADKIDAVAFPYTNAPTNRPPGTRNNRYGYGRVNAQRSVQRAALDTNRDLFVRDTPSDTGIVPQPAWGFWNSPDIWVRNNDDNGTAHQNTIRGRDNFIYVRVRNRGSLDSHPCWVRVIITTFAGTQFRYPFDYKPNTTGAVAGGTAGNLRPHSQFPAPGSYLVGVQRIASVPGNNGSVLVKVRWPSNLIPPAANWHPCILVEVSPHDGPAATGPNVWENNNLAQKNISIVNARRNQLIEFPYRFSHPQALDSFVTLNIHRVSSLPNLQTYFDIKRPALLSSIAQLASVEIPQAQINTDIAVNATQQSVLTGNQFAGLASAGNLKFTFIDSARAVVSIGQNRENGDNLMITFKEGSVLELGSNQQIPISSHENAENQVNLGNLDISPEDRNLTASLPSFSVTQFQGTQMLALNPQLNLAQIKVPVAQAGILDASLRLQVPATARIGDTIVYDVGMNNEKGQLTGGVRLQVNVTG